MVAAVSDTVHVIPVGDLIERDPDDECVCGPTTQPVELDDGAISWMMLHHSLGGRTSHPM